MEEANKNLQNLLKECREKNQYYTQKLNEQKSKEKELNFENLYKKSNLTNTNESLNKDVIKKEGLNELKIDREIISNKDIRSVTPLNSNQIIKEVQNENHQKKFSDNNNKNFNCEDAKEMYDSNDQEENFDQNNTNENNGKNENEEIENQSKENSNENYISEDDKDYPDNKLAYSKDENDDNYNDDENEEEEEEEEEIVLKEENISNFKKEQIANKFENKNENPQNFDKEKQFENDMPNAFSLNQEKIKNNLQTNLPLKITQKSNNPNKEKLVQNNLFEKKEEAKLQNNNNNKDNQRINSNIKYSGRSYSEESENDAPSNDRLNKYDLSLSGSISENSDKIKSKNKKNFERSSDSSDIEEERPKSTCKVFNKTPVTNKLTIHQKIGASIPKNTIQKENLLVNNKKVKGSHHTAYTFSTIVKMKKETKPNKTSVFKDKVLGKKYNGTSDRVAIYQYLKNEWSKTPILKKKLNQNQTLVKEEIKEKEKENLASLKVKNIRPPISYYKKF